jgi:nicotinate-nucleotide adenylyltransferase
VSAAASKCAEQPVASTALSSLGILGGTFNPPHLGHLALARHARDQLGLQRLLLIPAHTAPFKAGGGDGWQGVSEAGRGGRDPGPQHRLRMCQLAVDGVARVCVCPLEVQRGGVSYTVDTLSALHDGHPQAQLTLIVGADVAGTLGSWHEPARLLQLARLAIAGRPGTPRAPVLQALAGLGVAPAGDAARSQRVSFLEMPAIEISSSLVRQRVASGEPIEELVGGAVADYIAEHRLYRAPTHPHRGHRQAGA